MPVIESRIGSGAEQQQKRAAYGALIQSEIDKWGRVVKTAGIKVE